MNNNNDEKKYNPTLALLYQMKSGFWGLPINTKDYDSFMNNIELGGRIVVKINQHRKGDKSPHAYLEIIPAAKVKEMEAARAAPKPSSDEI